MLELHRRLRDCGVLGINRRNAEIIRRWNPRRLYPLVDDKLLTKRLALAAGMPVPELFGVIETQHDEVKAFLDADPALELDFESGRIEVWDRSWQAELMVR